MRDNPIYQFRVRTLPLILKWPNPDVSYNDSSMGHRKVALYLVIFELSLLGTGANHIFNVLIGKIKGRLGHLFARRRGHRWFDELTATWLPQLVYSISIRVHFNVFELFRNITIVDRSPGVV